MKIFKNSSRVLRMLFATFIIFFMMCSSAFAVGTATLKDGVLTVKGAVWTNTFNVQNILLSYKIEEVKEPEKVANTYLKYPVTKYYLNMSNLNKCNNNLNYIHAVDSNNHRYEHRDFYTLYSKTIEGSVASNGDNILLKSYTIPDKFYLYYYPINLNGQNVFVSPYENSILFYNNVSVTAKAFLIGSKNFKYYTTPESFETHGSTGIMDPDYNSKCKLCGTTAFFVAVDSEELDFVYRPLDSSILVTSIGSYSFDFSYGNPPSVTETTANIDVKKVQNKANYSQLVFYNCDISHISIDTPCTIESGRYRSPNYSNNSSTSSLIFTDINYRTNSFYGSVGILNNPTEIIVNKGTIIDPGNKLISRFMVGDESVISDTTTSGGQTVTTVKLENPPIIIDWADMPAITVDWTGFWEGFNMDVNAPTIEVQRLAADNPTSQKKSTSTKTPVSAVTITINAQDPDGNNSPTPISINGGAFQANGCKYTATENEVVEIMARDSKGNTRSYSYKISNIDSEAPMVMNVSQSNTGWTKNPVTVTVTAEDDVKLHDTAYKFEFTPNSTGTKTSSGWQASRTYTVSENGTLRVGVRDTLYTNDTNTAHFTWSEPYYVRNIDNIAPTATISYSVPSGQKVSEKVGVTAYVSIVDTADRVTKETSGLSNSPVAWTTGAYTNSLEKTYYANGTYIIQVKDALGNESPSTGTSAVKVVINQIVSDNTTKPKINSLTQNKSSGTVAAPVTLTVNVSKGTNGANLPTACISWDGGNTWTRSKTFDVDKNGEYTVMVRDENGNVTESSVMVSNIDSNKPTANLTMIKGIPDNWDYAAWGTPTLADYVWKLKLEANDLGSGLGKVYTNWDNREVTNPTTPYTYSMDVTEPGVYGVTITDKVGNETYVEKVVTAESIGAGIMTLGGGASGVGTDITTPDTGTAGTSIFPSGADLDELVFTPSGVLNKTTGTTGNYPAGKDGIPIHVNFTADRGNYVTGTATFNGVTYDLWFPEDGNSLIYYSDGRQHKAEGFIPMSAITQDIKNGRIKVEFKEWSDSSKTTLVREGSATLYTSTQVSQSVVNWSYNKVTDELTVTASSTVVGIKKVEVDVGSGYQEYTGPVIVGDADPIKIRVTDNAGNVVEKVIPRSELPLTGTAGGSLPTTDGETAGATGADGGSLNSYHTSNRAADIYILGGNRGNTNAIPDSSIYDLTD